MKAKGFWVAAGVVGWMFFFTFVVKKSMAEAIVWDGPNVSFSKPAFADWTLPQNQDRITDTLWITRGPTNGIFNAFSETYFSLASSPADARWAFPYNNPGKTIAASNYAALEFDVWYIAHNHNPPSTLNQPAVLKIVSQEFYIDVMFTSWGQTAGGGGAFSYVRSSEPVQLPCPADFDDSQAVDVFDLFELLDAWGTNGIGANLAEPTDVVDVFDLFVMLDAWGPCPR